MINESTVRVGPGRFALWFAGVAIPYALLLLAFSPPEDSRESGFFVFYITVSSALAVWIMSAGPALLAHPRTDIGRAFVYGVGLTATVAALTASAYYGEPLAYHPVTALLAGCLVFLASVPFFAALGLTLLAEWYLRLPKRPH